MDRRSFNEIECWMWESYNYRGATAFAALFNASTGRGELIAGAYSALKKGIIKNRGTHYLSGWKSAKEASSNRGTLRKAHRDFTSLMAGLEKDKLEAENKKSYLERSLPDYDTFIFENIWTSKQDHQAALDNLIETIDEIKTWYPDIVEHVQKNISSDLEYERQKCQEIIEETSKTRKWYLYEGFWISLHTKYLHAANRRLRKLARQSQGHPSFLQDHRYKLEEELETALEWKFYAQISLNFYPQFKNLGIAILREQENNIIAAQNQIERARLEYDRFLKNYTAAGYVYIYYGERGNLLYVGKTTNPFRRFVEHHESSSWFPQVRSFDLRAYATTTEMDEAEIGLIQELDPPFNIVKYRNASKPIRKPQVDG